LVCGISILITLASFWHLRINQAHLDRINSLNQGISTCFTRISQTFTALMIKDIRSPYLNRSFMALSDECLNETIKGINPFKKEVGKGYYTLNQLISEVNWFHETVLKIHAPMIANQTVHQSMTPLTDRFGKMENFKVDLMDEIEVAAFKLKKLQRNDEYLIGLGLIFFVLTLGLLSLQDHSRIQVQKKIEENAANLLRSGKQGAGAVVDQLIDNALMSQNLQITAQVFRDYHGDLLETVASKQKSYRKNEKIQITQVEKETAPEAIELGFKTSIKEVLVSIQNSQPRDLIVASDVRDVALNISYEILEQILSSAINQLVPRRVGSKKIIISNQIHSDKSIVNVFLGDSIFTASELNYAQDEIAEKHEGIDINLIILKEIINESGIPWHLENKIDRNGNLVGANIKFTIKRAIREKSKLIAITKGKKRDLARDLMN